MKKISTKKTKTVKAAAAPETAAATEAAVVKPVQSAPAEKPAVQAMRTTIVAKIDVGFGNALYIRG